MKFQICKRGGRGVDIALHSHTNPGRDTVYWSPRGIHDGRGGFNSFCLVDNPDGPWRAPSGERVSLYSINGIGEIRWDVTVHGIHYGEGAVEHFGLMPWDGETTVYVVHYDRSHVVDGKGRVRWWTHHWEAEKEALKIQGSVVKLTAAELDDVPTICPPHQGSPCCYCGATS